MSLLLLLLACDGSQFDHVEGDGAIPAVHGDRVVWFSSLQSTREAPPSWATGEVPKNPNNHYYPLVNGVLDLACAGDSKTLLALGDILNEHDRMGRNSDWEYLLLDRCSTPSPAFCRYAASVVGPSPSEAERTWWHLAAGCLDPAVASWLASEGAPDAAFVDYLATQDDQYRPTRLPGALPRLTRMLTSDHLHRSRAIQALAAVDDLAHGKVLAGIQDIEPWLYRQSDTASRARFDAWCADQEAQPWQCKEARAVDDLSVLTDASVDLSSVLDRSGNHTRVLLEGMADCSLRAATLAEPRGDRCIRALAGEDGGWPLLREALDHPDVELYQGWHAIRDGVKRFEDTYALRDELVTAGLVPAGTKAFDPDEPPADVLGWMIEAEQGIWTTNVPSRAMREVLARVPELADVRVIQRDPVYRVGTKAATDTDDTNEPVAGRKYIEVLLYADGRRHRALFPDNGALQVQMVGVLNSLSKARELDVRFFAPMGWSVVVWADEQDLRASVKDGLLIPRDRSMVADEDE